VLVHCTMGMSRSATLVLAYLVRHTNMSLAQALLHTKERRPVASPNPGFMQQLVAMEIALRGRPSIDVDKVGCAQAAGRANAALHGSIRAIGSETYPCTSCVFCRLRRAPIDPPALGRQNEQIPTE